MFLEAVRAGLIPAHAGKTYLNETIRVSVTAHPRACGENEGFSLDGVVDPGSSPRMRGKRSMQPAHASECGLIPAHAGKTIRSGSRPGLFWAHPRACGENISEVEHSPLSSGSSPRMRGKQVAKNGL